MLVEPAALESMLAQPNVHIFDARDFSEYGQMRLGNGSINSMPLSLVQM